ncbi:uncharacterized protein LOC131673441 [Phymastichus coffea]|uniref:uncharacterized protein LOC131673441 n=1 Tax=Phymastichus coffea TaxID=108790 RepID=UPI00273CAA07|nr:uncharacterized protein LOC131673441 [Phymastichus coffea]
MDKRKKVNILKECIKTTLSIEHLIYKSTLPPMYSYEYKILYKPISVNIEIGVIFQNKDKPNSFFEEYYANDDSLKIYTDGSKTDAGRSVGSACVCPELNLVITESIYKVSSIYTAECIAISRAMDIAIHNKERNVKIFSDSLGAILALSNPNNTVKSNHYIYEILQKNDKFSKGNNSTTLTVVWVPAHRGIIGNEMADKASKKATELLPTVIQIPHTDYRALFKKTAVNSTNKLIKNQGLTKGVDYFKNYYDDSNTSWYSNKGYEREFITSVCRCRSNHISLNESLFKINVISDPKCECGADTQELNHIVWQCPLFDDTRILLLRSLSKLNLFPPFDIKTFLYKPNVTVMRYILNYLQKSGIKP